MWRYLAAHELQTSFLAILLTGLVTWGCWKKGVQYILKEVPRLELEHQKFHRDHPEVPHTPLR